MGNCCSSSTKGAENHREGHLPVSSNDEKEPKEERLIKNAFSQKARLKGPEGGRKKNNKFSTALSFGEVLADLRNRMPSLGHSVNASMVKDFKMGVFLIMFFDAARNLHRYNPMRWVLQAIQSAASFSLYYLMVSSLDVEVRNKLLADKMGQTERVSVSKLQKSRSRSRISESSADTQDAIRKTKSHHLPAMSPSESKANDPATNLDRNLVKWGVDLHKDPVKMTINILIFLEKFGRSRARKTRQISNLPGNRGPLFIVSDQLIGSTENRMSLTRREEAFAEMRNPANCFVELINQAAYVVSVMASTLNSDSAFNEVIAEYVEKNPGIPGVNNTEGVVSILHRLNIGNGDGLNLFPLFEGHISINPLFMPWMNNNEPWEGGLSMFHLANSENKTREEKFSMLFKQWFEYNCSNNKNNFFI